MICTMMAGFMLIAMGMAKLGALIRFIPNSVIIGFTNGIAALIALWSPTRTRMTMPTRIRS